MDIEYLISHLEEFLTLAQLQNFSEAAEELYISQSSLSKHLQKMENILGAPLFDRTTRNVVLNEYGRQMLPLFQKLKSACGEIESASAQHRHGCSGKVTVNAIPTLDIYQFPQQIFCFHKQFPEYTVNIVESYDSTTPIDELRNGNCDLSFFRRGTGDTSDLIEIPYAEDHIVAVLSVNHRCARLNQVALQDLKNDDFALISSKTSIYKLCVSACQKQGFTPSIMYTSHRIESIVDMVEQNMAVALLTHRQAELVWRPTLSIVELTPAIQTGVSLYYKRGVKSAAVRAFIDFLEKRD